MITVLLVDDQALVRADFRALLDAEPDITVVGEAGDGTEAVRVAAAERPDGDHLRRGRARVPGGAHRSQRLPGQDTEPVELLRAVRVVAAGEALLSPGVTRRLIGEFARRARPGRPLRELERLTAREREIGALVAEGLSNDEIAAGLVVSPATAKTHVSRAMIKLAARDRAQLVVLAYETGLVRPGWTT